MSGQLGTLVPFVKAQWSDHNGDPAASHYLFSYIAGTSEKVSTYSDKALTTANDNPLTLDSAGRATVFLDPSRAYKFVLAATDDDPPNSPVWTRDNIRPATFYNVSVSEQRDGALVYWETGTSQFENTLELHAPYSPVILYCRWLNNATGTGDIDIPAGTLAAIGGPTVKGDGLVLEWETDYSSATLSARAACFGTNVDLGCGAASTLTRARFAIHRESNTNVRVDQMVEQNTGAGNAQVALATTTIGSLDLDATAYTVALSMASGTYTFRGARVYFTRGMTEWEIP